MSCGPDGRALTLNFDSRQGSKCLQDAHEDCTPQVGEDVAETPGNDTMCRHPTSINISKYRETLIISGLTRQTSSVIKTSRVTCRYYTSTTAMVAPHLLKSVLDIEDMCTRST